MLNSNLYPNHSLLTPMLNCPFNSNPDFVVLYNFFSVQFCTFMLTFHLNMTHLTLPWPAIKFSLDQGLFCGATDCSCFRLCDPPHGFQSGSDACMQWTLGSNLVPWFPHGLENLEKWENFVQSGKSRGILNRLEKLGNFAQNTGKMKF